MSKSTYNDKGEEILDPTPISIPVKFTGDDLRNRINDMKRIIQNELSAWAQASGAETFEEADDFDVDDDSLDPQSPWEEDFDPDVPFIAEREAAIRHGQVKDFDENRIHDGKKILEKYSRKQAAKAAKLRQKTKPEPKGSETDEFEEESNLQD